MPKTKRATAVILGMHRSGTSLTAKWLNQCGLHLGDNLIGSGVGNKDGHFEDLDFHDFHEEVFTTHNIGYGGLEHAPTIKLSEDQNEKINELIATKSKPHTHWGWKDPRTCLFLNHYCKILANPHYLVLHRSCDQVVDSLWRRYKVANNIHTDDDGQNNAHYRNLIYEFTEAWIQYNYNICLLLEKTDPIHYFLTRPSQLVNEDKNIITWLNQSNFNLDYVDFSSIFKQGALNNSAPTIQYSENQTKRITLIDEFYKTLKSQNENIPIIEIKNAFIEALNEKSCSQSQEIRDLRSTIESQKNIVRDLEGSIKSKAFYEKSLREEIAHNYNTINQAKLWQGNLLKRSILKWQPNHIKRNY